MNEFEKYPKLSEFIAEMASTGSIPQDWTGFIIELNNSLELTNAIAMQECLLRRGVNDEHINDKVKELQKLKPQ